MIFSKYILFEIKILTNWKNNNKNQKVLSKYEQSMRIWGYLSINKLIFKRIKKLQMKNEILLVYSCATKKQLQNMFRNIPVKLGCEIHRELPSLSKFTVNHLM